MKTTPTVFEKLPRPAVAPIMDAIHQALRKRRKDLYANGKEPLLSLRSIDRTGNTVYLRESNDSVTTKDSPVFADFRKDLLKGSFRVGELDTQRKPVSELVTDDAVRRHRKLGR